MQSRNVVWTARHTINGKKRIESNDKRFGLSDFLFTLGGTASCHETLANPVLSQESRKEASTTEIRAHPFIRTYT